MENFESDPRTRVLGNDLQPIGNSLNHGHPIAGVRRWVFRHREQGEPLSE